VGMNTKSEKLHCPHALIPQSKRRVNIGFIRNSIHLEILGFSATQPGSENAKTFLRIAEMPVPPFGFCRE
jgi:hypothetical protein